jgi:hypothetical protein
VKQPFLLEDELLMEELLEMHVLFVYLARGQTD